MNAPLDLLGLSSHATVWQATLLTLISLGVGVLGGMVGLALGTMRLPAFLLLGFPAPLAGGTNILVSTASSIAGSIGHFQDRAVDIRLSILIGIPSVMGAFIGGFLSDRAPESLLIGLSGIFVMIQGVEFTLKALRQKSPSDRKYRNRENRDTPTRLVIGSGMGFGVGLLGGAVGLILGSIRLPVMINLLGIDIRTAAGTNLVVGFLTGCFGFIGHGVHGHLDGPLLILMGISGMAGSFYGSILAKRTRADRLILLTGVALVLVGTLLVWNAYTLSS